jgi:hypothetical protein
MAVSQLSHAQILGKIRYDPLTKKGSVLDVIQLATATSSNHARMTWSSISTGFQEVANKIGHFKFPGQGQRPGKRLAIEGPGAGENDPITIGEVAADAGLRLDRGDLVRAGKAVAAAYRLAHDGATPAKHKQFVDGATRSVNTYFSKDRALIERALRDTFGA